jgi:hypothetical protein
MGLRRAINKSNQVSGSPAKSSVKHRTITLRQADLGKFLGASFLSRCMVMVALREEKVM